MAMAMKTMQSNIDIKNLEEQFFEQRKLIKETKIQLQKITERKHSLEEDKPDMEERYNHLEKKLKEARERALFNDDGQQAILPIKNEVENYHEQFREHEKMIEQCEFSRQKLQEKLSDAAALSEKLRVKIGDAIIGKELRQLLNSDSFKHLVEMVAMRCILSSPFYVTDEVIKDFIFERICLEDGFKKKLASRVKDLRKEYC